jgi:TolB-like protein
VDEEADLGYYERVAVAPFNSLAQDQLAGQKVADVFFTELLRRNFAQVVEPGQLVASMFALRGGTPVTNPWSSEELGRLGEEMGVQGVFMGTVRDYTMERVGRDSYPQISLEVRLVDTASGRIVWTGSQTRRGGPGFPIFGFGEVHTMGELTADMSRDILSTLPQGK